MFILTPEEQEKIGAAWAAMETATTRNWFFKVTPEEFERMRNEVLAQDAQDALTQSHAEVSP